MDANEYQALAGRTLIDGPGFELTPEQASITQDALVFVVAAAKVADLIKKGIYHQHGLDKEKIRDALLLATCAMRSLENAVRHDEYILLPKLDDQNVMLAWNALGLAGESGEAIELVHDMAFKHRDQAPEKELGDTLWYVAALCSKLGLSLSDVMSANIEKLRKRYPEGYSSEASMQRVDLVQQEG